MPDTLKKRCASNRKKYVALIVFLMFCLLLVSCSKSGNSDGGDTSPNKDTVETEYLPIRVTGDLHDSVVLEYGAKTSKGYYEIVMWPESMLPENHGYKWYGNIVYTDYETGKRVYLCNTPGCTHNTPDCTSFVQYSGGGRLFTDYSENHLYLMSVGRHGDDMKPDDVATITEMEMDGSNRRIVCELSASEAFSDGSVEIASDKYMYAMIGHTELLPNPSKQDQMVPVEQYVLERIWFADGRREIVCNLTNDFEVSDCLLSTWNDEDLIVSRIVYGKNSPTESYRCRFSQSGELIEQYGPESTFCYYSDQFRVTGEEKNERATVTAIDYKTGEKLTIENVPAANLAGRIVIYKRDGYKLNWTFYDSVNEENKDYILDFSNGSYKELTLRQKNTYEDMAIAIIAESADEYLVIVGEKTDTITITDLEGIPHTFSFPNKPIYALISKEDYWDCTENYRYIDNKV